jgi:hypothetical protein
MRAHRVASARSVFSANESTPAEELVALERNFFRSICLPNGTHKTTSPSRLHDVDQVLGECLPVGAPIHLLDVGISSGVTTLELLDSIESQGHEVTGVGVDIRLHAYLKSWFGLDILHDADGHVLQVATPFFAKGRPDHPLLTARSRALQVFLNSVERHVVRRWLRSLEASTRITLVSPRILHRRGFRIVEQDIAKPIPEWAESYDVVRAANILNRSYFAPEVLARMVANLAACLRAGGLLVVCRTKEDGTNDGTIFRKQSAPSAFLPIRRVGLGSEIEPLLLHESV